MKSVELEASTYLWTDTETEICASQPEQWTGKAKKILKSASEWQVSAVASAGTVEPEPEAEEGALRLATSTVYNSINTQLKLFKMYKTDCLYIPNDMSIFSTTGLVAMVIDRQWKTNDFSALSSAPKWRQILLTAPLDYRPIGLTLTRTCRALQCIFIRSVPKRPLYV